jgi:probable HAF family extracellular repeat protein
MSTPSAPIISYAPQASNQQLEYQWDAPSSEGSSAITGYRLTLDDGTTPIVNTYGAGARYASVTGLTNGTLYTATIEATNDGLSYGTAASFRSFEPGNGVPDSPASVLATAGPDYTTAIVSWTAPSSLPDSTIFWYVIISQSSNPADPVIERTADGLTQTSLYITGLNPASTYTFTVSAVNCPGYSPAVITNSVGPTGMVDLGVFSGGTESYATAASTNGSIVVGYADVAGGSYNAFIYQGGAMTQIDIASAPGDFRATGVSGDGSILVGYTNTTGADRAFKYTSGVGVTLLTLGVNSSFSRAFAISSNGTTIVGLTEESGLQKAVAYFSSGTTPTILDTVPIFEESFANAVSSNGSVIVGYGTNPISYVSEAFYYSGATITNFGGAEFSGYYSYATGITADGTIIVGYYTDNPFVSGYFQYGFVYTVGGSYTQIDAAANIPAYSALGLIYTTINGISADGSIVVGYASSTPNNSLGDAQSFKYTVSGAVYTDLGTLGGETVANAISGNGSIIVGYSYDSVGGAFHAFKYTN